jgi:hypothetical protein
MVEIKNVISFDEFNAIVKKVVDDCFEESKYSPAYYEISLRTALLCAFAPDFSLGNFDDNNTLFETVMSDEADMIIDTIKGNRMYLYIEEAINKSIDYRIKMLTSSPMSMADMALATLIDTFTAKVNSIPEISAENIELLTQVAKNTQDSNFASNLVDTMLDKGMLAKPNRETRRKNGQRSTKAKTNVVKEDE